MNPADYVYIGDLSQRHIRALKMFVEKYRRGAAEHGDLSTNKKWTKDMLGEAADLAFYVLFELMEIGDGEA